MPKLRVAVLSVQGQDIIIVPVDDGFGVKSEQEQAGIMADIQLHASAARMPGTVVPVWNNGGRVQFVAPRPWHPFFARLSMAAIIAKLNRDLVW